MEAAKAAAMNLIVKHVCSFWRVKRERLDKPQPAEP
jgi:hypothetical protein